MTSFVAAAALLTAFVVTERRAQHPITPLRLFNSRQRSGAYVARILVVGSMFSMFFFVTQYLQGVSGFSALESGIAFLPMSAVMFGVVRVVPRLAPRFGETPLLIGGLLVALAGMAWLSQLSEASAYFPTIALPLVLLGVGIGVAITPLTSAGIAGVAPEDAGAASGLVNVAHQLGGALGIGILVTVFAAAERSTADSPLAGLGRAAQARHELAQAVSTSLTGSAILLALGLAVVVMVMRRPAVAPALARTAGAR
jgi:predicted MFS family arabinose efflux permease